MCLDWHCTTNMEMNWIQAEVTYLKTKIKEYLRVEGLVEDVEPGDNLEPAHNAPNGARAQLISPARTSSTQDKR